LAAKQAEITSDPMLSALRALRTASRETPSRLALWLSGTFPIGYYDDQSIGMGRFVQACFAVARTNEAGLGPCSRAILASLTTIHCRPGNVPFNGSIAFTGGHCATERHGELIPEPLTGQPSVRREQAADRRREWNHRIRLYRIVQPFTKGLNRAFRCPGRYRRNRQEKVPGTNRQYGSWHFNF
jgi:hypothetical protein